MVWWILALLENATEFARDHRQAGGFFEGLRGAESHAGAPAAALDHATLGF
jgi:hypothetical protein